MTTKSMPATIKRAIKSVIVESDARTDAPGETIVCVESIINKLDEYGYWKQPLSYTQKYSDIANFLFPEDTVVDDADTPAQEEFLLGDPIQTALRGRKAVHVDEAVSMLEAEGFFLDVEDDAHVN